MCVKINFSFKDCQNEIFYLTSYLYGKFSYFVLDERDEKEGKGKDKTSGIDR